MVSVAVCTVKTAGDEHIVQSNSSGHDWVKMVPVVRSWMPPGHPVTWLLMLSSHGNKMLSEDLAHIIQRPCH